MNFVKRFIPAFDWIPNYKKEFLSGDLVAGFTVAVMLIPQAMAYAMLAGLPPIHGLYASIAPLVLYALLGTSRQLAVGPVAMDSLLVATGVAVLAEPGSASFIAYAIMLALMVGVIQIGMGVGRLGFLTNFLSHPVISGFTSAAALIIGLSQLKYMLGVPLERTHLIHRILGQALEQWNEIHGITLAIGIASVIVIKVSKKIHPMIPAPLISVALSAIIVWAFGLNELGVSIVGTVPAGLPSFALPAIDKEAFMTLIPTAIAIAVVGFMEAISVAKRLATERKYEVSPNQELIALGAANLSGSFFQGYPVTGGFSRSAVNAQAGANTNLASLLTAFIIALSLVFLTPLFYFIPKAVLASIIMVAVFGLIDLGDVKRLWKVKKIDLLMLGITFFATLSFGIQQGILIGVVASMVVHVFETTRPHWAVLGQLPESHSFRNIRRYVEAKTHPHVIALRIDAQFYYGNVTFLKETLRDLEKQMEKPLQAVVIDASGVNTIDSSAEKALQEIYDDYESRGIRLYVAHAKGPVLDLLKRSGFYNRLGADHFFLDVYEAHQNAIKGTS